MKILILFIFFASISFTQIKSLSEQELKDELTRCLIERLGFKQQAEQTDSLISELQKSQQREWLKDYELRICAEQLLNFDCPKQSWYDTFGVGFLASIFLIVLIYTGIAVL